MVELLQSRGACQGWQDEEAIQGQRGNKEKNYRTSSDNRNNEKTPSFKEFALSVIKGATKGLSESMSGLAQWRRVPSKVGGSRTDEASKS